MRLTPELAEEALEADKFSKKTPQARSFHQKYGMTPGQMLRYVTSDWIRIQNLENKKCKTC